MAFGHQINTRYATHYSGSNSSDGWNGWLYPMLFVVLPLVAFLMVMALIACNVYEYYQKKKRLQQYEHCSQHTLTPHLVSDKTMDYNPNNYEGSGSGYNESQYTYNTIVGNYFTEEINRTPIRPMSGWVAPHM
ncbi:uncharacterized protein LOC128957907 [Oppia nitens]|uniref:uncharacterized protein LOC128957907 n=1 Tax=Oppia nitens TaxID=1686743 RepID=UPI0023DCC10A|nr:uncharacterized protein LOC128957907 [Oppia nitens]